MSNYYDVLGLPRNADDKQIRKSYRNLARKYHPDLNPNDKRTEEKFKKINEAYEILSDPGNRKKYDRYGDNWRHADQIESQRKRASNWSFHGNPHMGSGGFRTASTLDDLFNQSGSFGRNRTPKPVNKSEVGITVSLEEAFIGTKRQITVSSSLNQKKIEVEIPPGVDNGSVVNVSLERDTKIALKITVSSHVRFQRKGDDLYVEIDVPLEDAILGSEMEVQTLKGRIWLKIPKESQNGQRIRLAGQGMSRLSQPDKRGDLYAIVRPVLPENLNESEIKLFKKYKNLRSPKE